MHETETLEAIAYLLDVGEVHGYGVTLEPVDGGSAVGWVRQMQGGHLVQAATLKAAASDAYEPLWP